MTTAMMAVGLTTATAMMAVEAVAWRGSEQVRGELIIHKRVGVSADRKQDAVV